MAEPRSGVVREDLLDSAFGGAEPEHFRWQTETPFVSDRERELVQAAFSPLGERVLDLGCGEGATLLHLGRRSGATGIDLFEDKLAFARKKLPDCTFVKGTGYGLPFDDGAFDHVLIRDVIHHVADTDKMLSECRRVLAPGGRIDVLEPCRYNPLIFLHAVTTPVERGELRSTPRYLSKIVGRFFRVEAVNRLQPMPVHRLVFHPKLGNPKLASSAVAAGLVDGFEGLAGRLLPRLFWAYIHVRATRF